MVMNETKQYASHYFPTLRTYFVASTHHHHPGDRYRHEHEALQGTHS